MVKYSEIKIVYASAPMPPEGVLLGIAYTIIKRHNNLYITDGNAEIRMSQKMIKMLFKIKDKDLTWDDIDFNDNKLKAKTDFKNLIKITE